MIVDPDRDGLARRFLAPIFRSVDLSGSLAAAIGRPDKASRRCLLYGAIPSRPADASCQTQQADQAFAFSACIFALLLYSRVGMRISTRP